MALPVSRRPALALGLVVSLGAGIAAPIATGATTPAPQVVQRALIGSLLGTLTDPVAGLLPTEDVVTIVDALTAPIETALPVEDVTKLLDVVGPEQLTQLVEAEPATVAPLLAGLLPTVTALAADGATPTTEDVTSVLGQLTSLLGAGVPTTVAGQDALAGLLAQVTTLLAQPGVAELPVVDELTTILKDLETQLPAALQAPVQALLAAAATAPAAVADPSATFALLLGLLGGGAGGTAAPAGAAAKPATATRVVRARISSVALSKDRRTLRVRLTCPASAAATGCRVSPRANVAGRTLRLSGRTSVKRGGAATLRGRVPSAAARRLRATGGRVVVRVRTTGSTAGAVTRTVKVRRIAG